MVVHIHMCLRERKMVPGTEWRIRDDISVWGLCSPDRFLRFWSFIQLVMKVITLQLNLDEYFNFRYTLLIKLIVKDVANDT